MLTFRFLRADEVEARVSTVTDSGISLLLYKDARCDMRILDETVGPGFWQREHYECKGNLFCRVEILGENGWVGKSDCGTESNTEKEKGEASDSFKRACFNWGIGRELYTAPFIWVPDESKCDGKANFRRNDKGKPVGRFVVTYLKTENGKIIALNVENASLRRTVYTYGNVFDTPEASPTAKSPAKGIEPLMYELHRTGKSIKAALETVKKQFGDAAPENINAFLPEHMAYIMEKLKELPDAGT